jgi:drug/metabolite transporter (DMT)-like permease
LGNSGYQIIGYAIAAAVGFWVYTDAKKRGMNAVGWGIGAALVCIVFLPLYLIIRKPLLTAGMPGIPPGAVVYTQAPPPPPPGMAPPPPQGMMAPPPPPPGAAPAGGPVHFCVQCGQKYEGTVKFCPSCGATQS